MHRLPDTPDTTHAPHADSGEQGSATNRAVAGILAGTVALGATGAAIQQNVDPTKLINQDPTHQVTQQLPESIYDANGKLREGIRLKVAKDTLQPRNPEDGIVDIVEENSSTAQNEASAPNFGSNPSRDDEGIKPNVLANAVKAVPLALAAEAEGQVYGNLGTEMPSPKPPHPNNMPKGGE